MPILSSSIIPWDLKNMDVCELIASGSAAMNNTLDNAVAVDQGGGIVKIPCTGHGFVAGSMIGIRGSTNYDGTYEIIDDDPDSDSNAFTIYATYVSEEFSGSETVRPELEPGVPFQVLEARLHLSAVGGAAENYVITLDSGHGSAFDIDLVTENMNAQADIDTDWTDTYHFFNDDDRLLFTYANSNGKTWGLEVKYAVAKP